MAARIPVLLSQNPYEIIVGNETFPRAGEFIRRVLPAGKCAVVTDSNVGPLHAKTLLESLKAAGFEATLVTVPAGEKSKSLGEVEKVCDQMIRAGLDRGSFVVALGGGVVGDLAGFVASIYFRGVPHVQIPTTVMAQVDSSIGGKTGVNSQEGKNLIGSFHQPKLVITDPGLLATLPKREFNEGFAEVIKHAVIRDAAMLEEVEHFAKDDLASLVARNIKIKAKIVAEDEFERHGIRALLNFGHTVGHAIENAAGYGRYLHGEAISLGIAAALELSEKKAGLPVSEGDRVIHALRNFGLPVTLPNDLKLEEIMTALTRDKKFEAGAIRYVLTPKIGDAFVSKDVTAEDIRKTLEELRD